MKKLKKLGSVLLALAVMFVMTSTAFASTYTLTLSGTVSGHTYDVYQIFTGDVFTKADGKKVLSNIKYGENYLPGDATTNTKVSETDLQNVLDNPDSFAQTVVLKGAAITKATATSDTTAITGLAAGYYLIKESTVLENGKYDSISKFMLQVVGPTNATVKAGVPAVEKKIAISDTGRVDVADYNIGDTVNFEITGTLPSNYNEYSKYKYEIYDTLSSGLTYNNDNAAKVYVKNGDNRVEVTSQTTISHENGNLTISFADLKTLKDVTISSSSEIIVEYSAILNNNAVIGLDGNPNEVYLKFSNNPNNGGSGEMGKTPTDQVVVFTYELDVTKVDGKDNTTKLQGAEFVLLNSAGKFATVSGGKVTGWVDAINEHTTLTSDANGLFVISGLDAGTYKLRETKAPEGYNLMDKDVEFTISATLNQTDGYLGTAKDALTALTIKVGETTTNGVLSTGIVTTTVVNNAGTVLPSTGGIGTTLFYVIGGVLVLAAIVLLVTRRRMREE